MWCVSEFSFRSPVQFVTERIGEGVSLEMGNMNVEWSIAECEPALYGEGSGAAVDGKQHCL